MAYVISDDCIACGTCIDECPVEAISEGDKYSINPDLCTECELVLMLVLLKLFTLAKQYNLFFKANDRFQDGNGRFLFI